MERVSKYVGLISRYSGIVGSVTIVLMMLVVMADISRRYLLGRSILGAYEFVEILVTVVFFLTIIYTQLLKGHLKMDLVVSRFPERLRNLTEAFVLLLGLGFTGVMAWVTWGEALRAISIREFRYGAVPFPTWPGKLIMAIGLCLLCIQLLVHAIEDVARFARR